MGDFHKNLTSTCHCYLVALFYVIAEQNFMHNSILKRQNKKIYNLAFICKNICDIVTLKVANVSVLEFYKSNLAWKQLLKSS